MARRLLLVLNAGSSSLKFAAFTCETAPQRQAWGAATDLGSESTRLDLSSASGQASTRSLPAFGQEAAFTAVAEWLERHELSHAPYAVAHRIVHGGPRHQKAEPIDDKLLVELQQLSAIDPDHLPAELALVRAARARWSSVPQLACFDTAFFRDLPRVARLLAIPHRYEQRGLRRYGFHGLSYTYLLEELERLAGPAAARGRVVLAHLGAGSSLTAVHDGQPVDTTMGFSPASGVMTYRRTNHKNLHVRGYKEEGTTTTPFDMVVRNDLDRFHLVQDVIDRGPSRGARAGHLRQAMADKLVEHVEYIRRYGKDMPEAHDFRWKPRAPLLVEGSQS